MNRFINLMGHDVWSEADIVSRTEAMVRGVVSATDERIINRKLQGAMLGQYTLSIQEQEEVERFARVTHEAQAAGAAARADMALLQGALNVEAAQRRLAQPVADPAEDDAARAAAQAVVDGASQEVLALVALRNPMPEGQP